MLKHEESSNIRFLFPRSKKLNPLISEDEMTLDPYNGRSCLLGILLILIKKPL